MCHLLLFLPVIALPVLWLLPLSVALPIYGLAVALVLWIYVLAVRTARRPAMTGAEGMIGEHGRVVELDGGAQDCSFTASSGRPRCSESGWPSGRRRSSWGLRA